LVGLGAIETSLDPIFAINSSILVTKGGLFCKNPLLRLSPLGDLKLVIEMVSPVLTVKLKPFCVAVNPAILRVNGVTDCADRLAKHARKKIYKKPVLIIHKTNVHSIFMMFL
jgi:hypothetical protein